MLPELLVVVHRLWAVDEPSVELFASGFGVAFERYEDRPSHFQFYRAQHRLGALKASFGPNGASLDRPLAREVPADPAHPITLGAYVMEYKRYIGVYASPGGPVFFHENQRFDGAFGSVTVTADDGKFRIVQDRRKVEIPYTPRTGLHTNPHDREQSEIDLVALMVRGSRDRTWWDAYTRPWVL